jgi:serine/threonine-protein kinase
MQASIIDKLIEEALLEFTSLTDDKAAPGAAAKPIDTSTISAPLKPPAVSGARVDVGSWIDEIAVAQKPDNEGARASLPIGITAGNLAALEEDEDGAPSSPRMPPPPSTPRPVASAQTTSSAPPPGPALASAAAEKKNGSRLGVFVALVVVMAAGAAAWFTHLIPHQ